MDLFLGWNGTTIMFGTGMRHIREVRSMDVSSQTDADWHTFLQVKWTGNPYEWTFCANVGMEWKVSGIEGEGFMPNSSFHISLSTLQHTEVKMLTTNFGPLLWWLLPLTVMFTWKAESFRVLCFWCIVRKRYSWTLYDIVYSNINLD